MPKARYAPLQRMRLFGETSEPRAASDNQQPYVQSTPYQATVAGPSHFKHISDVSSEGGLFIEDPVSLVQAARVGESDEHRSDRVERSSLQDLPDYKIISFGKVDKLNGLEACLPNRSTDEILLIKKLLCFDPAGRATVMDLLHDKYLNEDPLPVPPSEPRIPSMRIHLMN
ncbi:hypothetical protein T459_26246 [Capsicum annuum]|uniref:Uncharacterized protein n=1 Tax=Capsicum annuum TaxID=4072 RepID=A0A2G2YN28_CAPAN|nr:hypothetical protein T459_26246 [Capsicum annuum]